MKHMVSYTLKADCVAENERLARAVYDGLARGSARRAYATRPSGWPTA